MGAFTCFQLFKSSYFIPFSLNLMHILECISSLVLKFYFRLQGSGWIVIAVVHALHIRRCLSAFAAKTSLPFIQTEHCHLHPYTLIHPLIHLLKVPRCLLPLRCAVISILPHASPRQCIFILPLHTSGECICLFGFPPQVGFHINHHLILHCEPGCLPDSPEDGSAHRVGRRPGRSDSDRVRHHARRIHNDLLPGQRLHTSLHLMIFYTHKSQPYSAHAHRLTSEPVKINGSSVMLSYSSPSCPFCLPPLTTGFICFLSDPRHNNSISFSSGRGGTVRERHTLSSCSVSGLTLERKRECL